MTIVSPSANARAIVCRLQPYDRLRPHAGNEHVIADQLRRRFRWQRRTGPGTAPMPVDRDCLIVVP